jgi:DNA-binding response OmpR family regulator
MDLESILTDAGCKIVGAAGALDQAKALCSNADCDAALVDANLKGHAVDELAVTLTTRNIPFAFVTGYGRDGLPNGFQEAIILKKPFRQDELLAVVELLGRNSPGVVQLRRKEV